VASRTNVNIFLALVLKVFGRCVFPIADFFSCRNVSSDAFGAEIIIRGTKSVSRVSQPFGGFYLVFLQLIVDSIQKDLMLMPCTGCNQTVGDDPGAAIDREVAFVVELTTIPFPTDRAAIGVCFAG